MRLLNVLLRSRAALKDISVISKDVLKLNVVAGDGGYGLPRFNGIGGNGGSVLLRVNTKLSFTEFCERYMLNHNLCAANGQNSQQVKLVGKNGSDLIVDVPYGVECVDESSLLLARCLSTKKPYLIARGGEGGCAMNSYKYTRGEHFPIYVHLKLRPNVAMLGFPNAGKSTLLKALVPEKPVKIANYPFTTRNPQVCYLKFKPENSDNTMDEKWIPPFTLSLADLPGIIEGASRNRGVGHAFLKHLEYADIVAMVVDVHGFQLAGTLNEPYRNALESVALLNREVDVYSKKLLKKRYVLLLNKIDIMDGEKKANEIIDLFRGENSAERRRWVRNVPEPLRPRQPIEFTAALAISARTGQTSNLKEVLKAIHDEIHPRRHPVFEEDKLDKQQTILS